MSTHQVIHGNSLDKLKELPDRSVDSVVTDPPYELGFMGKSWDASGIAYNVELWREVLRVLKPGGHLLAFGGTRTFHRMVVAIEDAGFEIRDMIEWLYGSGFPKSFDVSKAIDKAAGVERVVIGKATPKGGRTSVLFSGGFGPENYSLTTAATPEAQQWVGWGTALKPAHEPITVARKPLAEKTVAANVLTWGTGAINVDESRVDSNGEHKRPFQPNRNERNVYSFASSFQPSNAEGRWPANVILNDEAAEVLGESSRFFYVAKPSKSERPKAEDGTLHPTVKPIKLMEYLVRMVTPPGGTVLDPFAGSGATLEAAKRLGFNSIGIELTVEYLPLIQQRLDRTPDASEEK